MPYLTEAQTRARIAKQLLEIPFEDFLEETLRAVNMLYICKSEDSLTQQRIGGQIIWDRYHTNYMERDAVAVWIESGVIDRAMNQLTNVTKEHNVYRMSGEAALKK